MAVSEAARLLPGLRQPEASALTASPRPELLPLEVSAALLRLRRRASVRRADLVSELLLLRQAALAGSVNSAGSAMLPLLDLHLWGDSGHRVDSASAALLRLRRQALGPPLRLLSHRAASVLDPHRHPPLDSALLLLPHLSPDSVRRQTSVSVLLRLRRLVSVASALLLRPPLDSALLLLRLRSPDSARRLTSASVLLRLRRLVRHRLRRVDSGGSAPVQLLFRRVESA